MRSYSNCEVKVIDFGSSCFIHDNLSSYVQSRPYRAPEVIIGHKYDSKIDLWSLGCILAELWTGSILFQNDSLQGLLAKIIGIIGPFPENVVKESKLFYSFFNEKGLIFKGLSDGDKFNNFQNSLNEASNFQVKAHFPGEIKRFQIIIPKQTTLRNRLKTDDNNFYDFICSLL